MKKFAILLGLAPLFLSTGIVSAAGNCAPVYGGGSVCDTNTKLTINKQILNPQTNSYIDKLGTNDTHFQPGQVATFHITVTNTTSNKIKNITVKDYLPTNLMLITGNGTYDTSTHVLSFTVDSLNGKESKTYTITGRLADNDAITGNTPLVCMTNGTTAESGSTLAQDNTGFCVEKSGTTGTGTTQQGSIPTEGSTGLAQMTPSQVPNQTKGGQLVYAPQGNSKSPATGPEALGYAALLPLGALGAFLRKKN